MSNHSVGTYTNTIPIPSGMQYALVRIYNRTLTSTNNVETLVCYINRTANYVLVYGRVNYSSTDMFGSWLDATAGFITGKKKFTGSNYTYNFAVNVLGVQHSFITDMAMTDSAITMTVNVENAEGDKGYGYFVDWTVW